MGREMGGRFKRDRIYVYVWLIHVEVWQKTTKFCKAIILHLKKNFWKRKSSKQHPGGTHVKSQKLFPLASRFHGYHLAHQTKEMRITKYETAKAWYVSHLPECSLRLCSILITLGAQNTFIHNSYFAYYPRQRKRSRHFLRSQTCWFMHAKLEPGQLSAYCCFHVSPSIALGWLRCPRWC